MARTYALAQRDMAIPPMKCVLLCSLLALVCVGCRSHVTLLEHLGVIDPWRADRKRPWALEQELAPEELLRYIRMAYRVDYDVSGHTISIWDERAPTVARFPVTAKAFTPAFEGEFRQAVDAMSGDRNPKLTIAFSEADRTIALRSDWRTATVAWGALRNWLEAADCGSPLCWKPTHELPETHRTKIHGFHLMDADIEKAMVAFCAEINRLATAADEIRYRYHGRSPIYLNWEPNECIHADVVSLAAPPHR